LDRKLFFLTHNSFCHSRSTEKDKACKIHTAKYKNQHLFPFDLDLIRIGLILADFEPKEMKNLFTESFLFQFKPNVQ